MVKLTNEEIGCISTFESLTGAVVLDCILDENRVVFLVKEGDLGKAIGKGGSAIRRVRSAFGKRVDVVENAETAEEFTRNFFQRIRIKKMEMMGGKERGYIQMSVEPDDRGAAIGRNGDRIKLARSILERRFRIGLKLL